MKWFGKKREENVTVDHLAGRIAKFILKLQSAFARQMNKLIEGLSITTLKYFLLIFLIIGTAISFYVAASAISKRQNTIAIKHLQPNVLVKADDRETEVISKNEYEQLQKFDHFIDSLHKVKSPVYDSMLKFRHGLLDSVKLLESYYKNQFSNQK